MENMKEIDFLGQPSVARLRKEIVNICNSYSHPWDILAELCQNSVDAILLYNQRFGDMHKKDHYIEIHINSRERSIYIKDTGIGFSPEKFAELLAPNGTDKDVIPNLIGEKGVGLTYTIFISNEYIINTKSVNAYIKGRIKNASLWKNGKINNLPCFEVITWKEDSFAPEDTYTEISIKDVEKIYPDEEDIFYQTVDILVYLLRTKTAIGWLKGIFENRNLDVKVKLKFSDINGKEFSAEVPTKYMLPQEFVSNTVELGKFKSEAASLDDRQKAKKLQGKAIVKQGSEMRSGRKINFYAFFAPSRNLWKDISEKNKLFININGEKKYLYQGGIYVGIKGMPTGVVIEPPVTGYAGYWPNFYIILEDDSITMDVGRKSIPGRTKGILKEIAKNIFQEFIPFIKYTTVDPAVTAGTLATIQQYEKHKEFENLRKLPDIGIDKINYLKHPDGQEAGVVALFHELVVSGLLKGYYTLKMGYKQTYDLWGIYRIKKEYVDNNFHHLANEYGIIETPIIIEFKYRAEDILDDFEKNIKYFTDIDLIVCWDLDETKFTKQGVKVEPLTKKDVFFYGSNYKLIWPGAYNLGTASEKPVLALRKFIQDYVTNQ